MGGGLHCRSLGVGSGARIGESANRQGRAPYARPLQHQGCQRRAAVRGYRHRTGYVLCTQPDSTLSSWHLPALMGINATMRFKLEQEHSHCWFPLPATPTRGPLSLHPPHHLVLVQRSHRRRSPCRAASSNPGRADSASRGEIAPSHHTLSLRGMVPSGFTHPVLSPGLLRRPLVPRFHGRNTVFVCSRNNPTGRHGVASRDILGGMLPLPETPGQCRDLSGQPLLDNQH